MRREIYGGDLSYQDNESITEEDIGSVLKIAGWVENIRTMAACPLLTLGTCMVSCRWYSEISSFQKVSEKKSAYPLKCD